LSGSEKATLRDENSAANASGSEGKHGEILRRDIFREFHELWTSILSDGVKAGVFRAELDVEVAYRFIRDTVWVAVRWYDPAGSLTAEDVADQYLGILLDGIATSSQKGVSSTKRRS
jgi:hypothetical protein